MFINIIDPQTTYKFKFDIFRRINTGGKELNNQESGNIIEKVRCFTQNET